MNVLYNCRCLLTAALLCQILAGCGGVYQTHGSETIENSRLAFVEFPNRAQSEATIKAIDGRWPGMTDFDQYQFSPGEHSITAQVSSAFHHSRPLIRRFVAESGKTYQFKAYVDNTQMQWDFGIFEKDTQQRIDLEKSNLSHAPLF